MVHKKAAKKPLKKKRVETKSPPEERFFSVTEEIKLPLIRQYQVGPYYLDFAYVDENGFGYKLAIEVDGQRYHSSYHQRQKDYERERYLLSKGWIVVRFTASEINKETKRCADEIIELINFFDRKLRMAK